MVFAICDRCGHPVRVPDDIYIVENVADYLRTQGWTPADEGIVCCECTTQENAQVTEDEDQ